MPSFDEIKEMSKSPIGSAKIGLVAGLFGGIALATTVLISMQIGYISRKIDEMLNPELAIPSYGNQGHKSNVTSTEATIPIVYGECKIGISNVYISTSGVNNKYINIIACLCEGEIDSLQELALDNRLVAEFGSLVEYTFHTGSSSQSYDTDLYAIDNNFIDAMRNTSYLYLKIEYSQEKFQKLPTILVKIRGKKLYDIRDGTTAYSNNPALVLWDLIVNSRYGLGISSDYLDTSSWEVAANWCDTNGYTFNGSIRNRGKVIDLVTGILSNFRGILIWSGGKFKLKILDYDASVMNITQDDVLENTISGSLPAIRSTINTVRVGYVDSEDSYNFQDIVINNTSAIDVDGDIRERQIELNGTVTIEQATKIGNYIIDRSRLNNPYNFTCRPKAIALEPADIIKITLDELGWTNQVCRVISLSIRPDYFVDLVVVKESEAIYDDAVSVTAAEQYTTTLINPNDSPAGVESIAWTENVYTQGDNTYSRVKITFKEPSDYPFWDYAEVYMAWGDDDELAIADGTYKADGSITAGGLSIYRFKGKEVSSFTIDNLREGQTISIKIVSVSIWGVKQSLGDVLVTTITVEGLSTEPLAVSNFQALPARDGVNLRWDAISFVEQDIVYYEVRKGTAWGSSVLLGRTKSTSWPLNSLQPGTYTFLIKAKNTGGVYSETAASSTCIVYVPIGYTEFVSSPYNEDYDSGTHNSTAYEDDGSFGRLLYVSSGTEGDYTGITFDLGSVLTVKVSLEDYDLHYYGEGTTWNTTFESGETWADILSAAQSWINLYGSANTGTYHIKFYYSEDNVTFYNFDFVETYSPEIQMRYFYIKVYINNYSESAYIKIEDINIRIYESA